MPLRLSPVSARPIWSIPRLPGRFTRRIRAIHDTSRGLALFVDSYRKLAELQEPVIGEVYLNDFMEGIRALYPDLEWHLSIPLSATMCTDQNMLRQVLINLIRNACEAGATTVDVRWKKGCGSATMVRLFRWLSNGRFLFLSSRLKGRVPVSACRFPGR